MRRWHQEQTVSRRQWRIHQKFVHDDLPTGCDCDDQVGRFRKRRALDCGHARCQLCHFDKIHGIKTHHQRVADVRFREQLVNHD
ncbi:MAG TPA: hypothetical protein VKA46_39195 [Gemmataceae bacterium]|nr:hypothetical protein [Gemmataceae bacterium]